MIDNFHISKNKKFSTEKYPSPCRRSAFSLKWLRRETPIAHNGLRKAQKEESYD
jgi:hypothetical protein